MVLSGRLLVEVEKAGADTVAAQIGDILTNTADFKTFMQSRWIDLVDKLALPILTLSAVAWPVAGLVGVSTICNAAFAYNMRVLAPIGMLNHLNLASQRGILIKDRGGQACPRALARSADPTCASRLNLEDAKRRRYGRLR